MASKSPAGKVPRPEPAVFSETLQYSAGAAARGAEDVQAELRPKTARGRKDKRKERNRKQYGL